MLRGEHIAIQFFEPRGRTAQRKLDRLVDFFLDPLDYVGDIPWEATWGKRVLKAVHTRSELLALDPTLERTFDPYAFVRDAWIQQREFDIFDGNPPPETLDEEFIEEEPPTDEAEEPAN